MELDENIFIALFLEGFLYGLYSGIIAIYLQYHASKQDTNKTQNILFYSMCTLYVSSAGIFASDITWMCSPRLGLIISDIQVRLFACCDFIAQFILIYRCWIVWGRNIRIVIIPSILACAFLAIWIVGGASTIDTFPVYGFPYRMTVMGLALSLTVNALVTGLIVFRIFKVFREVKAASGNNIFSAGGSKLRRIILVLIESAMALFSIQLARLVVSILQLQPDTRVAAYSITVTIHQMLNGITPTIILVQTSMGLSFHDEKSMEEVAIGSLHFASNHPNSVSETGSIDIVDQDIGDDHEDVDIQRSNNIDVVESA